MKIELKPIVWSEDSLDVIQDWPKVARKHVGAELYRLQMGSEPLHWKPMKTVGRGVREIRISQGGAYRVLYVVRREDGILVLHAFEKTTRQTAKADIDLGKQRLKSES